MSNYSELLKDPRWQKKRLRIFERDKWACTECHSTERTLSVHHKRYQSHNPWETDDIYLVTLCNECHETEEYLKTIEGLLTHATAWNVTCVRVWKVLSAFSFLAKKDPDEFSKFMKYIDTRVCQKHFTEYIKLANELLNG